MASRLLLLAAVVTGALALAGCATPTAPGTPEAPPAAVSETGTPATDTSALVPAVHPQCDRGTEILRYLATGNNEGDPSLDEQFAGDVGVPAPQARQIADAWIAECEQAASSADASAASAASESAAQASSDAAAASFEQRAAPVCTAAGGHLAVNGPHPAYDGDGWSVDCISNSHSAACGGETLTIGNDLALGPPDWLANDRAAGCFH